MLRRMQGRAGLAPAGLVAALMAVSFLVAPAQAHEWPWRDRVLPNPYAGRDPSDPGSASSRLGYQPTTQELKSYRPVDPLPWRDVNKRVSPSAGSTKGHQH